MSNPGWGHNGDGDYRPQIRYRFADGTEAWTRIAYDTEPQPTLLFRRGGRHEYATLDPQRARVEYERGPRGTTVRIYASSYGNLLVQRHVADRRQARATAERLLREYGCVEIGAAIRAEMAAMRARVDELRANREWWSRPLASD